MATIPPSTTPTETVGVCIQVPKSSEWLGLVTGVLLKLTYNYYWDQSYENWEDAKNAGKAILQSWFDRVPCGADLSDFEGCKDFPLTSAMFSWYPLSPYTNAGEVPDGWTAAPFTVYDALPEIAGYQIGDVIASGFANPDSGDFTLPAFGIDVTGTGTVEIHLINALNGGVAIITVDDDLLNSVVVELNADTVEVPPENLGEEIIHEVKLETTGEHHIDVRFSPTIDDALIPVRFGGGLRSIVLCGFDEMMIDVRQNPSDPCDLQKTNNGTDWVNFADLSLCGGVSPRDRKLYWKACGTGACYSWDDITYYEFPDGDPTEGTTSEDFGIQKPVYETGVDKPCVAANNVIAIVRSQVDGWKDAFATAGVLIAIQALIAAAVALVITAGAAAPLIAILAAEILALGYQGITSQFDGDYFDTFLCDLYTAFSPDGIMTGAAYATLYDTVQARTGGGGTEKWSITLAFLSLYGVSGLNNMANQAGITECAQTPCEDSSVLDFNFRASPYSNLCYPSPKWYVTSSPNFLDPYMSWEAGIGWRTTGQTRFDGSGSGMMRQVFLVLNFPDEVSGVTEIRMEYTFDRGHTGFINTNSLFVINSGTGIINESWSSTPDGYQDRVLYSGSPITISAGTWMYWRAEVCGSSAYPQDFNGEFVIHRLKLTL